MTLDPSQVEEFRDAIEADLGIVLLPEEATFWAELILSYHMALYDASQPPY